jgi:hypothetical protein
MSYLDDLRRGLGRLQNQLVFLQTPMGELEEQLAALTEKLKGHAPKAPDEAVVKAVERFQQEPRFRHSHDALLVSLGCDRPIGKMRYRLIEDSALFPAVLSGVDRFRKHRPVFRDCYKGLLDTYLAYHPEMKGAAKTGRPNWEMLRSWLDRGANILRHPDGLDETWVSELLSHPELFSNAPVDAFGRQMLREDDSEEFLRFQQALGIERKSWLMEQVVLAQVRAAAKAGITPYIPKLLPLLEPLAGQNPVVFNQGLGEVLSAYCDHSGGPLHGALRDFSLHFWGNPLLLHRESTTGWVAVPRAPREMVKKWFKLHVIQQFFNVLAKQDQQEDDNVRLKRERRRDFWEKYADVVGDVKFALGPNTRNSRDPRMVEVIKLMDGMTLDLYGAGDGQNNAFIMRFGDWVVAEFGHENNRCFIYRASDVPFENGDASISAQSIRHHIPSTAYTRSGPVKLRHHDTGGYPWEDHFEEALMHRGTKMPVAARASKTSSTTWKPQTPERPSKPQAQTRAGGYSAASHQTPTVPVTGTSATVKVKPHQDAGLAAASQHVAGQSPAAQTASASAWRNPSILRPSTRTAGGAAPEFASTSNALVVNLPFGANQEKELLDLCRKYDIYVRDMREREGNLWVALDKPEDNRMTHLLRAYGFKYRPGRGWWRQA